MIVKLNRRGKIDKYLMQLDSFRIEFYEKL
jgi:hypothetical protein